MTFKTLLTASAILLGATTVSFAQSMPNYGPNAPATGDSLGKPPSGTRPPGVTRSQRSNYPKRVNRHYHRNYYVRYE
ncbi:MAG TPA: hypothetical protein VFO74_16775 [Pseudolabrys sp.]|jgi:hypothetical protein|nr:hypothetical protein [Pseudolabrys sp.]